MTRNLGVLDRTARLLVGAMLLGLYGAVPSLLKPFTLLGLLLAGTAMIGFCPVYGLFKIRTRSAPEE